MNYVVTGATGFIGRFLVAELLKRENARVYAVVRTGSEARLDRIRQQLGVSRDRLITLHGNLTRPLLGLSQEDLQSLQGKVDHVFHLAAIYDLKADAISQHRSNVEGTRNAVKAAEALRADCFHHVSSIAVAGIYPGVFYEDMFEQATGLHDPYFRTKHDAEKCVREECHIPYRIYRPSMVVGDSKSGEMDKVDGPYYLFKIMQRLHDWLPRWLPLVGIEGGQFNIVPVDYVVQAMDHIAHQPGLDGGCFHLTADRHYSLGELLNLVAECARAPRFSLQISNRMLEMLPQSTMSRIAGLQPVNKLMLRLLNRLDVPPSTLGFLTYPTRYDRLQTANALQGTGLAPPALETYIPNLWRYWRDHLDPDRMSRAYMRRARRTATEQ